MAVSDSLNKVTLEVNARSGQEMGPAEQCTYVKALMSLMMDRKAGYLALPCTYHRPFFCAWAWLKKYHHVCQVKSLGEETTTLTKLRVIF